MVLRRSLNALSWVAAMLSALLGVSALLAPTIPALSDFSTAAFPGLWAAVFSFVLWTTSERKAGPGWLSALSLAVFCGLLTPEAAAKLRAPPVDPPAELLTIVQFNLGPESAELNARLSWILAQSADVIALQEVSPATQPLVEALTSTYPFKVTCEVAPHPCEVVLLSRRAPIASGQLGREPNAPNTAWARYHGAGGDYVVIATHLPRPTRSRSEPLSKLAKEVGRHTGEVVLTGDFNATPSTPVVRAFERAVSLTRRTHLLPTWPAPFPLLGIDHVYASQGFRTVSIERGPALGSDHYPIVATLSR